MQSLDGGKHDVLQGIGPQGQCNTLCQHSDNGVDLNRGYADWENGLSDITADVVSLRYGTQFDPYGKGIIRYDFEVPAGYYAVEVGFMAPFVAGYDAEIEVNGKSIATGHVNFRSTAVLKGTANVREGQTAMEVKCMGDWSSGIQIAYIKVYKGEAPYAFDETVVDDANVDDLLYFVDAGDYDTSTVPEGEKLGLLNSKTDQLYGEDATTGYSWGLQSWMAASMISHSPMAPRASVRPTARPPTILQTLLTGATRIGAIRRMLASTMFRCAMETKYDPYGKGIIRYDFEVPAGYYDVEVGFMAPFNNGYDAKSAGEW